MQAIQTKHLSVTNTKGSRIKATCAAKSITVNWDYSLSVEDNHIVAAKTLLLVMNWDGCFASGQLKSGSYVHVFVKH